MTASPSLRPATSIADPSNPTHVFAPNSDGTVATDGSEYKAVAASQTAVVLGATGATGDYLGTIWIIPATTSPGAVSILDNSTSMTIFTGGATSVADLKPFPVRLGARSVNGAWKVTTGAAVSIIAVGDFT